MKRFALLLSLWLGFALPLLAGSAPPTASATSGSWRPQMQAFARVSAGQETVMSLPFAVRVLAVNVQPGAGVATDDELLRIDAPELRQRLADWQQQRQQLKLAR